MAPDIRFKLFGKEESAIGKEISFEKSDSAQLYRVGAVSTNIRYDNFSNSDSYYADKINNDYYNFLARDYHR